MFYGLARGVLRGFGLFDLLLPTYEDCFWYAGFGMGVLGFG